jgi:hypothetical protein
MAQLISSKQLCLTTQNGYFFLFFSWGETDCLVLQPLFGLLYQPQMVVVVAAAAAVVVAAVVVVAVAVVAAVMVECELAG